MADYTIRVALEAVDERVRQDAKWGEQNHTPVEWISVLTEEVGEAAMEANKDHWGQDGAQYMPAYRQEMIQIAAVALAAVECLDRQSGGAYRLTGRAALHAAMDKPDIDREAVGL